MNEDDPSAQVGLAEVSNELLSLDNNFGCRDFVFPFAPECFKLCRAPTSAKLMPGYEVHHEVSGLYPFHA